MSKQVFNDFSGGITDLSFGVASNFSEIQENFLPERDKSLICRNGFELKSTTYPRIPSNKRGSRIVDINGTKLYFSNGSVYHENGELLGPTGIKGFVFGNQNTIVDVARWGDHYICVDDSFSYPVKIFKDENGNLKLVQAGLPKISGAPVITPSTPGSSNYIYAFAYKYTYKIGTTTFLDIGEPILVAQENGPDLSVDTNSITGINELTNGVDRNYDVTNVKVQIYRTENNGTTLYLVDEVDNGTTDPYIDNTTDEDLIAGAQIYTLGGVEANQLPPRAKYVTVSANVAWYGNIIESEESKPYRLKFSKVADPDSVPGTFFEDFESDITGLASLNDNVIVFTTNKAIRVSGVLDDTGRGNISRFPIVDAGAVSNGSVVTTSDYVYWFSDSGIYRTDGHQYDKLTKHLDQSYQTWASNLNTRKISATYDKVNQRVLWCVNEGSSDNDTILVFDEIYRGFSKFKSGSDLTPAALYSEGQELIHIDHEGYIFSHRPNVYTDPVKDQFKAVTDWDAKCIPYKWKHIAWDMGDGQRVKWVPKINIIGRPETNIYLEPRVFREGSIDYYGLSEIKLAPLAKWGDPSLLWGDPAVKWNAISYLNMSRRMASGARRTTHLQLSIAPAYTKVVGSVNEDGHVSVNAAAKTASLINPGTNEFSRNLQGHDLWINGQVYKILSASADTFTVEDTAGTLVDGIYAWEVKGYPKGQRPHIASITADFTVFGDSDKLMAGANNEA